MLQTSPQHPIFCGQNRLDRQNPSSYTHTAKREVPMGAADGIFINTSGIGTIEHEGS
jgi:hypothetical protein